MSVTTVAFGDKKSPRQVLIDALEDVEGAQNALVIFKDKNDYIQSAWSSGSSLERIGMLQVAIARQIGNMMEEYE